jgi:hypothetical protein
VCDRCGFLYNHKDLQWQYIWAGARTANQNLLVCYKCLDDLQEQLRAIVLPADPVPIKNPRIERYNIDDNPISPIGTAFGTMTQAGGVKAAFDSNTNKPFAFCAATFTSTISNTVGVNFGSSQNAKVATNFTITAPNNAPFLGSGTTTYLFQGSNLIIGFTTLASGNTAGSIGEVLTVPLGITNTYQYYQLVLGGDNIHSVAVAQLTINQAG